MAARAVWVMFWDFLADATLQANVGRFERFNGAFTGLAGQLVLFRARLVLQFLPGSLRNKEALDPIPRVYSIGKSRSGIQGDSDLGKSLRHLIARSQRMVGPCGLVRRTSHIGECVGFALLWMIGKSS